MERKGWGCSQGPSACPVGRGDWREAGFAKELWGLRQCWSQMSIVPRTPGESVQRRHCQDRAPDPRPRSRKVAAG